VLIEGYSERSDCSAVVLMSVARTFAPCAANAIALARPMPAPAAVTMQNFPDNRPAFIVLSRGAHAPLRQDCTVDGTA